VNDFKPYYSIVVSGTPIGKGRPQVVHHNNHSRAITPTKTVAWETRARMEAQIQFSRPPLTGAIEVSLYAYFPIPASWPEWKKEQAIEGNVLHTLRPDVDNVIKCLDAFNGVCWEDDARIAQLEAYKVYSSMPRFELSFREISGLLNSKSKKLELEDLYSENL
jgi:Holliday junction resolvase RusA-like endonuclease